jgi:hypothetical protein
MAAQILQEEEAQNIESRLYEESLYQEINPPLVRQGS